MAFQGAHEQPFGSARQGRTGWSPVAVVLIMLLGLAVAFLTALGIWAAASAQSARDDAHAAAAGASTMPGMDMGSTTSTAAGALQSYAGAAPANADALAAAHVPYPAALPPALTGPVANVNLVLKDITVQIAPGVKYAAWAWAGGAPGPVIHVRQGQLVKKKCSPTTAPFRTRSTSMPRVSLRTSRSQTSPRAHR